MKKLLLATALFAAASAGAIAFAQVKPGETMPLAQMQPMSVDPLAPSPAVDTTDARSIATDQDVADARRTYRAACDRYESSPFCECVTAGVAQALMPAEVRIAARTIGDRITVQGDAAISSESDAPTLGASSAVRIEQVEGHYADTCSQFRG